MPREILAVGISSLTCWKAHRFNGGSCQFASVTRDCAGNGGAPLIGAGRPPAWSVAYGDAAISATAGAPYGREPHDRYIVALPGPPAVAGAARARFCPARTRE